MVGKERLELSASMSQAWPSTLDLLPDNLSPFIFQIEDSFGSTRWIRTNLSSAYKADARTVCARADGTEEKNRTSIARLSVASTNHCRTPVYFGGKVQSRTEINSFSDCSLDHLAYLTAIKTHHKSALTN